VLVAVVTASLLIVAGLPFLRVNFIAGRPEMLPPGSTARQVTEQAQRDFPGVSAEPIASSPRRRRAIRRWRQLRRSIVALGPPAGDGAAAAGPAATEIDLTPRGDPISDQNLRLMKHCARCRVRLPKLVAGSAAGSATSTRRSLLTCDRDRDPRADDGSRSCSR